MFLCKPQKSVSGPNPFCTPLSLLLEQSKRYLSRTLHFGEKMRIKKMCEKSIPRTILCARETSHWVFFSAQRIRDTKYLFLRNFSLLLEQSKKGYLVSLRRDTRILFFFCTLYFVPCTLYSVLNTLYPVQGTLYHVLSTLYLVFWIFSG